MTDGLTVLPKKANENTAVSEDSNPVVPTSGGTALLGTEDGARTATETERYAFGLRQLIDRKKSYPSLSRKMGETGQVLIRARVARDGTLSDVAIQSKSKFPRLDQAALEIVSAIGKYEPIPESIPNAPLLIAIPIEYSL